MKISISIGVACFDVQITDLMAKTSDMLDLALNRGGNQATVYIDGKIRYFGGKEIGSEIRLPIYVRMKTEDLCELIEKSPDVMIMAHSNSDTDAFGACVGLLKICMALGKEAKIVIDEDLCDAIVKKILNEIRAEHIGMNDYFITSSKAISQITSETLLILVDVQYEGNLSVLSFTEKLKKLRLSIIIVVAVKLFLTINICTIKQHHLHQLN